MPPPYSVATSLPTYDEAEKAKAAALAAAAAEVAQRVSDTVLLYFGFVKRVRILIGNNLAHFMTHDYNNGGMMI